eukprot:TRINITY_DN34256_c0_g1_i2.p1 TRINITY_DN34256_c0_g1~~TRINITY_DN34256_c0_g1_i2.p1  ORF type:complete len:658 (+),score=136.53 TRINITY_DN34256_c0_g1_i2:203-2176(+)
MGCCLTHRVADPKTTKDPMGICASDQDDGELTKGPEDDFSAVPLELFHKYKEWKRMPAGFPAGSQFAFEIDKSDPYTDRKGRPLVYSCTCPETGYKLFIKSFDNGVMSRQDHVASARQEWEITQQHLQPPHPNVLSMKAFHVHNVTGYGFAAFPYLEVKDLFDHIAAVFSGKGSLKRGSVSYCEREVQFILRNICENLQWMHRNGVAHRDIKPENVMGGARPANQAERESEVQELFLVDLGTIVHFAAAEAQSADTPTHNKTMRASVDDAEFGEFVPCSVGFVSPEQFVEAKAIHKHKDGFKRCNPFLSDVFAVGGIMCVLLLGAPQKEMSSTFDQATRVRHLKAKLEHTFTSDLSDQAKDLLIKMVQDEGTRPTIHEVLEHPWFTDPALQEHLHSCDHDHEKSCWKKALATLNLRGRERVHYEPTDWYVFETGSDAEYVIPDKQFHGMYSDPRPISDLTAEEKVRFSMWSEADKHHMELYHRDPKSTHKLVEVTPEVLAELRATFYIMGEDATYICDARYPNEPGSCAVHGAVPDNVQLTEFVMKKTGGLIDEDGKVGFSGIGADEDWPVKVMLKQAVFAKQMLIPGACFATRALHPFIEGKSDAFAFQAAEEIASQSVKMPFLCVGDFIKLSVFGDTVITTVVGKISVEANMICV